MICLALVPCGAVQLQIPPQQFTVQLLSCGGFVSSWQCINEQLESNPIESNQNRAGVADSTAVHCIVVLNRRAGRCVVLRCVVLRGRLYHIA